MLGTALWTIGLLAWWSVVLTFHGHLFRPIAVIHRYPFTMLALGVAAMAAGFITVRRGIAPLAEMRRRLAAVRHGSAARVDGTYPSEVQPVVSELNGLLDHQERAIVRAQAKAGDLAHGLKTPLAILTQESERARTAGHADLASAIDEQVDRIRRQIDYHLAHARAAASGAMPGARSVVVESAQSLARTLLRLHADRGLTISVLTPPDHAVRCQREDLDEMLGNLLDNACKWARSRVIVTSAIRPPEGGSDNDRMVDIFVDDDGPGIEASMREAVLQRGVRADEAASGSGFGLAIVGDLAGVYGGGIVLSESPSGGLRARLRLPAAG